MLIDRLTFTGADDSVQAEDLLALSGRYPFLEWGILFSKSNQGAGPRWPSKEWVDRLVGMAGLSSGTKAQLAAHLCGKWQRDIVMGMFTWHDAYAHIAYDFARVQINTHAEPTRMTEAFVIGMNDRAPRQQFILQVDGVNDDRIFAILQRTTNVVPLFDTSHGAGQLPESWPEPRGFYCGYAGGLGPDNVRAQLDGPIGQAATRRTIWIDMERRVRSEDDSSFELNRVKAVIDAVEPFVVAARA